SRRLGHPHSFPTRRSSDLGRTARAGAGGAAVSFCDHDEVGNLKAIERLIRRAIPVKEDQPELTMAEPAAGSATRPSRGSNRSSSSEEHTSELQSRANLVCR